MKQKTKLLPFIRWLNKFMYCNLMGRITIEKKFKEKEVYNYVNLY